MILLSVAENNFVATTEIGERIAIVPRAGVEDSHAKAAAAASLELLDPAAKLRRLCSHGWSGKQESRRPGQEVPSVHTHVSCGETARA